MIDYIAIFCCVVVGTLFAAVLASGLAAFAIYLTTVAIENWRALLCVLRRYK